MQDFIIDLKKKLDGGEISAFECSKITLKFRNELKELENICLERIKGEREIESAKRMGKYNANKEWYDLRSKLIQAWRDARTNSNREVIEQINYLRDSDLLNVDSKKVTELNVTNKGVTEIFKMLEDLILIEKK